MTSRSISNLLFAAIIMVSCVCMIVLKQFPLDYKNEGQRLAFQWQFLLFISIWGAVGFFLSRKTGFPDLSQPDITNRSRFGISAIHGIVIGSGSILLDIIRPIAEVYNLETIHHPLPEGIAVYLYAAIISEFLFHLLPVPLIIFLISNLVLKGKHQNKIFWIAAFMCSFWEIRNYVMDPKLWHPVEFVRSLWSYLANFSEIWLFRKFGLLAAINQRLASYSLWHILWPAIQG